MMLSSRWSYEFLKLRLLKCSRECTGEAGLHLLSMLLGVTIALGCIWVVGNALGVHRHPTDITYSSPGCEMKVHGMQWRRPAGATGPYHVSIDGNPSGYGANAIDSTCGSVDGAQVEAALHEMYKYVEARMVAGEFFVPPGHFLYDLYLTHTEHIDKEIRPPRATFLEVITTRDAYDLNNMLNAETTTDYKFIHDLDDMYMCLPLGVESERKGVVPYLRISTLTVDIWRHNTPHRDKNVNSIYIHPQGLRMSQDDVATLDNDCLYNPLLHRCIWPCDTDVWAVANYHGFAVPRRWKHMFADMFGESWRSHVGMVLKIGGPGVLRNPGTWRQEKSPVV
jgi:hypothetical protein